MPEVIQFDPNVQLVFERMKFGDAFQIAIDPFKLFLEAYDFAETDPNFKVAFESAAATLTRALIQS